jgi:prepilin-type N-terminal cleavage/methylation domain-containing protein
MHTEFGLPLGWGHAKARGPMKTTTSFNGGFTLVEIMIVIAIIGLLAGIAVPNYLKARTVARANTCINHLRQIDAAIQEWATETKKAEQQPVHYSDISAYLKGAVVCPAGGTTFLDSYAITTVSEKPTCRRVTGGDHAHVLIQNP